MAAAPTAVYQCEFECGFEHVDFDTVCTHETECLKRSKAAHGEGEADNDGGWSTVVRKSAPLAVSRAVSAGACQRIAAAPAARFSGVEWPADLPYLTESRWNAKRLGTQAVRDAARLRMPGVFIKKIADVAHPVCGAYGLFAAKAFRVGDVIGEYVGDVVDKDECAAGGDGYMAALGDGDGCLGCDAGKMGNEARFINDYRGCGLQNCRLSRTIIRTLPTVMVVVVKPIKAGEEILANYGGGFWG